MWSPLYTMAFIKSVLVDAAERREERGAAFTEYVVLVGAVVAFVLLVGFTDLGNALKDKITAIAGQINPA
jgi:Flp pilus assembly pilin Flp